MSPSLARLDSGNNALMHAVFGCDDRVPPSISLNSYCGRLCELRNSVVAPMIPADYCGVLGFVRAVCNAVFTVLGPRVPSKVVDPVVGAIAIVVARLKSIWLRPLECRQDKPVHKMGFPAVLVEQIDRLSPIWPRGLLQNFLLNGPALFADPGKTYDFTIAGGGIKSFVAKNRHDIECVFHAGEVNT